VSVILLFRLCREPRVFVVEFVHKSRLTRGVPAPQEKAIGDLAKGEYPDPTVQFLKNLLSGRAVTLFVGFGNIYAFPQRQVRWEPLFDFSKSLRTKLL
jgi:hypothetical protein